MLVAVIRKHVTYNLRRISAYVTYRNNTKTKIARLSHNETDLLSVSLPNLAARRTYSTEPQITLPMLVDGASAYIPSLLVPLKLLYLSIFRITPYIDKEFDISEFLKGARHATVTISQALANKDFESLNGLVSNNMIETLRNKIETLSPNQRQLITMNNDDILFYVLCDIAATTGDEHSIQVTTICHYIPGLAEKKKMRLSHEDIMNFSSSVAHLVCNYTFARKYVNNIGGPWIATFVNHYTVS